MPPENQKLKNKIISLSRKYFLIYIFAIASSIFTFIFFMVAKEIISENKITEKKIDIYKVAKEEAIKLGRLEPDEKQIVKEIGADGKVIIPSLTYVDIGGMGDNSNKSFWTNISKSKSFVSFDLAFSSYQGEKLTNHLTDFDVDFRKIVYEEIGKMSLLDFQGSKGKKGLLENIKNEFNAYLAEKDLDPIIFGAHFKVFVITSRK